MKKFFILCCCALLTISTHIYAAQPTTINYSGKGKTFTGNQYRTYTVRCSDGKKRTITSWKETKKWCVGKASEKKCSKGQLKAAAKACK